MSVQWRRVTVPIKSLPMWMRRIRLQVGQFDRHPVRCTGTVVAKLTADHASWFIVNCSAAHIVLEIHCLIDAIITIEDRI